MVTNTNLAEELMKSVQTSLIDCNSASSEEYRLKLLYNDKKQGSNVLCNIERELDQCDEFWFSVAFITDGGLLMLKNIFNELSERGIKGKILTTDYQYFNTPKSLRELLKLRNIETKVYTKEKFHTKGYMFKKEMNYTFVVGSSNLTQGALKENKEWNMRISSLENGELIKDVNAEFESLWMDAESLNEEWVREYEYIYKDKKVIRKSNKVTRIKTHILKPNLMQKEAIENLDLLRKNREKKALLISATGTGKTYLSAFDVRNFNPKKMLFLAHREQILKQALESYQDVLGDNISAGILSGSNKEYDVDYLFSTVQMMSKQETLERYLPEYFDYICIDETHRSGADSYQKIIQYFKPKFLLGMTASPERTDGFDIYQLFNHNIAYEIRLQKALEENMLCPFHYFGITDLMVDGKEIGDVSEFRYLISDERVNNIISKIEYYGYSGNRAKGLIFCSKKEEARELSELFNQRGYQTTALTGEDRQEVREEAVAKLEQDQRENGLDYIFIVDIFNEGIDIPCVNQVVMLRPTESAIIFVQQLGRGLRKCHDKEYVVVIDFIGNYAKNFLIPIALSGDRTYNKDTIRRYIGEGNRLIPGSSTINFDAVSKKRIFESIDSANFSDIKIIKESYQQLKYKLGKVPSLMDFEKYGEIDVLRIFDNPSLGSYYRFLVKYEKEYTIRLSPEQEQCVEFISKKFASGKRVHELLILKRLLSYHHKLFAYLRHQLKKEYNIEFSEKSQKNIVNILTNEFASGTGKNTYKDCILISKEKDDFGISRNYSEMLEHREFRNIISELIEFGFMRYKKNYSNRYMNTCFQLYAKYTYEDVCRLLEWEKSEVALNIGGYKYDDKTKTYPVFINYDKNQEIQDTIRYEDRFLNNTTLIAISKSGRTLKSEDVQIAVHAEELNVEMELFVRKNKNDKISKEFYYLGKIKSTGNTREFIMPNTSKTAVEIEYHLITPVREDIFDYITN